MADKIVRIKLDSGGAVSDANRTNRAVKGIGTSADSSSSSLMNMSRAAKAVGLALASAAVVKFFNDASVAAKNFNASISNLSAITGATGQDLRFLSDAALEFGATTTLSATQAAEALKLVASAKPDLLSNVSALKEVTAQAVLLAEASGGTLLLADAAKAVGKSLNQFGADASEAARFVNVLAAGSKLGSSEVLATSEALKEAGVSASGAKISFEETNAAIQVLAKSGIEGSQAGTALRNIFLKLETDSNNNLRPSLVGLSQALRNVNSLNETGAQQVKRFGLENINAAQFILNNIDSLNKLTIGLTGTNTAFKQASTNIDNLDGDLKGLNSAFESLQIKIGSLADEDLRALTQSTTQFLQALNGSDEALREWGGTIDLVGSSLEFIIKLGAAYYINNITKAVIASTVAFTANQAQVIKYNSALAAGAGVSRVAAASTWALTYAMRALKAALPFGAIFLGLEVLQSMITATNDQVTANDRYAESTRKLNERLDTRAEKEAAIALRTAAEVNSRNQQKLTDELERIEAQKIKLEKSNAAERAKIRGDEYSEADRLTLFQATQVRNRVNVMEEEARRLKSIADNSASSFAKLQGAIGGKAGKSDILSGAFTDPSQAVGAKEKAQASSDLDAFFSQDGIFSGGADGAQGNDGQIIAKLERENQMIQQSLLNRKSIYSKFFADANDLNATEYERQNAQLMFNLASQIESENQSFQTRLQAITDRQLALADNKSLNEAQKLEAQALLDEQAILARQQFENRITEISQEGAAQRALIDQREAVNKINTYQGYANTALSLASAFGSKSEKANKKRRKRAVKIDTAAGIARAFAENEFYTALGISALIGANGLKQLSAIDSASQPSSPSSASVSTPQPQPSANTGTQNQRRIIDLRGLENGGTATFSKEQLVELLNNDDDVILSVNNGQQQGARVGLING